LRNLIAQGWAATNGAPTVFLAIEGWGTQRMKASILLFKVTTLLTVNPTAEEPAR
jgi:hypothetical protein